ncbi:hypothetical protein BDV26DRAFT_255648 [Aspergillus bertholletiae]|uniref:ER-bound oxygenase mpaB/mpaB'/Rubber oxygenase catalytic domain-containing protein n=1 Tax=Aspergillus bertholletiae TaxID=1226010 RepID=A0A5N7BI95_9EURO|nr:hypothetical protein BDV26DRAFT_255648 [Aspergillus bertholletiae]
MDPTLPPHPNPGDHIGKWGYFFTWTDSHLSRKKTEPLRQLFDSLGSAALERLQSIQSSLLDDSRIRGTSPPSNDLYTILQNHHREDEVLTQFWNETHTVPDWVNWEQLERGQRFLYRYIIANTVGFALQGFVAENSAASGVVEVLVRTGSFSTRMLLKRLLETFQWLILVTHDLAAIQPGGEGHTATLRVRLLHSSVRQRILHLCRTKPHYFNIDRHGVPINSLDSIHSISTFACNPMWLQLPKFKITPSPEEVKDYIALFRYLGYLLGTPISCFETVEKSKHTMESLVAHELHTTDTSRVVAYNFIECVANLPAPFHVSKKFIEAGSRWINGDEICDELELGKPGFFYQLIFAGCCILVLGLAWLQRMIPLFDEFMIKFSRDLLYQKIGLREYTRFDFKHIPRVGKTIGRERYRQNEDSQPWKACKYPPYLNYTFYDTTDIGHFELVCLTVALFSGGLLTGCVIQSGLWAYSKMRGLA